MNNTRKTRKPVPAKQLTKNKPAESDAIRPDAVAGLERLRLFGVLETLPVYVILLSRDYHVPFANRFFRERFGESNGRRCFEYLFHRREPCENCETFKVLQTNAPHHWEWTGPDGRNYDIYDFPFIDADGASMIMETGIDVTEVKKANGALKHLNETLEMEVAKRTEELAATETRFRLALKNAPVSVAAQDKDLRFIWAYNQRTVPPEEVIGKTDSDIFSPQDARLLSSLKRRVMESGAPLSRLLWITSNGKRVFLDLFLEPMRNAAGAVTGVGIATVDLTAMKTAENALHEAQTRTSAILEGIADTFYSLDDRWRFTIINPAAERAPFGRPAAELLGKVIWDLYPGLVGTRIHRHYLDALSKQSLEHYEAQSPLNGRWYEVFMKGRATGVDVYMRDVTGRRTTEESLRESEARFKVIAETAPVGIGVVTIPDGTFAYVNQAYEAAYGFGPGELLGKATPEIYFDLADRDRILSVLKERGSVEGFEVRLKRKDGTPFWALSSVKPISYDGKPALLGIFTDITQRRHAETALRENEQQLREARNLLETVTQGSRVLIATVDKDFRYTFFNKEHHDEIKQLTGKDTVLGMSLRETLEGMPQQRDRAMFLWECALKGETIVNTLQLGEEGRYQRYYRTRHSPIRNAEGAIIGAGEVTSDITELIQAYEELRIKNEELTRFNRISIDRELRMIDLKKEINDLCAETGRPPRYPTQSEKEVL